MSEPNDWVIAELEPVYDLGQVGTTPGGHEFEKVEKLDFKQIFESLDQLEKSVRLLGRATEFVYPHISAEPETKLRPSVCEFLERCGRHVTSHRGTPYMNTKQVSEDQVEAIEITVKHESESGQMKLSLVGKRDEPVTIKKVKEAVVAELGCMNTSEFDFILKSGDMTALRLDYDVVRPCGKKRQCELVVRGIELPKEEKSPFHFLEQDVQHGQLIRPRERLELPPLSISQVSFFQLHEDGDLSPAVSIDTESSWKEVGTFDFRMPVTPPAFSMAQDVEYFSLTPLSTRSGQVNLRDVEASARCPNQDIQDAEDDDWCILCY